MESLVRQGAEDLVESRYAIALSGAGMSTESGIPRLVGGTIRGVGHKQGGRGQGLSKIRPFPGRPQGIGGGNAWAARDTRDVV